MCYFTSKIFCKDGIISKGSKQGLKKKMEKGKKVFYSDDVIMGSRNDCLLLFPSH